MRHLVTGGAGFLGTDLCRYLLERGRATRNVDILVHATAALPLAETWCGLPVLQSLR